MPNKLAIASMSGFSELDTLSLNFLEEEIFGLSEKLKPLSSSFTQTGNNKSGGQEKDIDELSDAGERTRDEDLNNK